MKKTLMIFTTALLVSCASKQFYTVCPVSVPNAWKKAPNGSLQYRQLKNGIYACDKTTMICAVTVSDYKTMTENMQKCEHARESLVELFETINQPKLRDKYGDPYVAKDPLETDLTPTNSLLPKENRDLLEDLNNVPIVDPRKP